MGKSARDWSGARDAGDAERLHRRAASTVSRPGVAQCPLLGVKRTWLRDDALSACDPKRTKAALKFRIAAVLPLASARRQHPARFRTIQVCPKDLASVLRHANRAVCLRSKESDHERASCTAVAGSRSQHCGSRLLLGPGPRNHASVGLRSSLKVSTSRGLGARRRERSAMLNMRRREFITTPFNATGCNEP
jgi:hypothetical protein